MKSRVILLMLALVCTGLSLFYVQVYVKRNLQEGEIVVLKDDIEALTKVTREMVETKKISMNALHPQSANRVDDVIGLYSVSKMVKGEQLLKNKLVKSLQDVGGHDYRVAPDERVIAVSTDLTKSIGGTVATGDQVDLIAVLGDQVDRDPIVRTIAQRIRVVDVRDQNAKKILVSNIASRAQEDSSVGNINKKNVPGAVLLAVKPQEAEQIILYQKIGEIYLSQNPSEGTKYFSYGTKLSQVMPGQINKPN
ncbi:MAG TPA: Flp pilus assembly protein CpaB [Bacillota bacterium]|nr:Flp pilus assembly protein CpaB [Bacillota bacterium]